MLHRLKGKRQFLKIYDGANVVNYLNADKSVIQVCYIVTEAIQDGETLDFFDSKANNDHFSESLVHKYAN